MNQISVGRSEITITEIGLGGAWGRQIDEISSFKVLDYAFKRGIRFFDSAEGPAKDSLERILGRWIKTRGIRKEITLCTKISQPVHGTYPWDWGRGSAENVSRALEGSLDRLQTDYVDIYKMHCPDEGTNIKETLEALTKQVQAGRIKVIGCSNYTSHQLKEALDVSESEGLSRFDITQPPYSLARPRPGLLHQTRETIEENLFPMCVEKEIAVTPYSPLGAGFLTGKFTREMATGQSKILPGTRMDVAPAHVPIYFTERNFRIVDHLRKKSEEMGVPMAVLALAFSMTHPAVTAIIVGALKTKQIDQVFEAYNLGMDQVLRSEMNSWD